MYAKTDSVTPCCATCRFFKFMEPEELADHAVGEPSVQLGRCVRYPPTFFYNKLLNGEFPVVDAETVCGEYASDSDV